MAEQMNRWVKFLLSTSLIFTSVGIAVLQSVPIEYSISMYRQIPTLLLIGASIIVVTSVLSAVYNLSRGTNPLWSYLPVYLIFGLVLWIPWLLGYKIKYGDPMIKLGNIRDLLHGQALSTGLSGLDKYPLFHIDIATLALLTGQSPDSIMGYIPVILASIFICSIIVIGRFYDVPSGPIIIFVPLVFHSSLRVLTPSAMAYLTIFPCILIIYHHLTRENNQHIAWGVLFIFTGLTLWILHLFIAFLTIFTILLSTVGEQSAKRLGLTKSTIRPQISLTIVLGIFGYMWFRYGPADLFTKAGLTVAQIFGAYQIQSPNQPIPGGGIGYLFSTLGFSIIDVIHLTIIRFGGLIILFAVTGVGFPAYLIYSQSQEPWPYMIPAVVLLGLGWSITEFSIGIIPSINWIRILRFGAIGAPVLSGWIVYHWISQESQLSQTRKTIAAISLSILLIVGLFTTMVGMYSAPISTSGNTYTTESDLAGWNWFFNYNNPDDEVITLGRDMSRYAEISLTAKEEEDRINYLRNFRFAPPHFQTENGSIFNQTELYYISDRRSRIMNLRIGYTKDFSAAELDKARDTTPQVNTVYDNGFLSVSRTNK